MEKIIGKDYVPKDNSWVKLLSHPDADNWPGMYNRHAVIESEPYVLSDEERGEHIPADREFVDVRSVDTGLRYRVIWNPEWVGDMKVKSPLEGIIGKRYIVNTCYAEDIVTGEIKDMDWVTKNLLRRDHLVSSNPYEGTIRKKDYCSKYLEEDFKVNVMLVNIFYQGRVYAVLFSEWMLMDREAKIAERMWM